MNGVLRLLFLYYYHPLGFAAVVVGWVSFKRWLTRDLGEAKYHLEKANRMRREGGKGGP